jgi:sugar lactone lactonase YvrE
MRLGALGATLALLATACVTTSSDGGATASIEPTTSVSASPTTTNSTSPPSVGTAPETTVSETTVSETTAAKTVPATTPAPTVTTATPSGSAVCPELPDGAPWQTGPSVGATVLQEGDANEPRVEAVVYPHPDYEGKPWSQWGQGVVLADGRHLSAIGDHHGENGNSFIFEYDPEKAALTPIADVLSLAQHRTGDWGYGKVHAQMVPGSCGVIWMSTYWGTRRNIEYSDGYRGDLLFAIDPDRRTISNAGVLYEEHGVPSLASSPDGGLLYAEAVDPTRERAGPFIVIDPVGGEVVFTDDSHTGFRAIAVDADGRAYYSQGGGKLAVYDPATNSTSTFAAEIPGDFLRAATTPDADGIVYGVSRDPEVFFALDPASGVRTLGEARAYTTSLALSPDGSTIYSVPDAHGGAWRAGAPLVAVDTDTGQQQVIIELADLVAAEFDLRLGGTYNVAVDDKTIYIGMNAGPVDEPEEGFGEVVLLIVTLP